ncbi:MAG: hypothetical protein U0892_14060 [Pirellulales bacterium]
MKRIAMIIGITALVGTILPPTLFMFHRLDLVTMQWIMLICCIAWFATAPLWMKSE